MCFDCLRVLRDGAAARPPCRYRPHLDAYDMPVAR